MIINRGYTGHEHLDAFGIINMNGRVYDPLTAQFFSPDPYIQSPDNWVNYNRYGYCFGNPLIYTDPSGDLQLGIFYASINLGWSPYGGLNVGLSAGVGFEQNFYAGISVSYGFKDNNWTFTGNVGTAGWYAYGGYNTKAGWIGGAGWAAPSPFAGWSPVSITTNMLSIGVDYSQYGGFSGNYMGLNIASDGDISYNPSVGVSLTAIFGSQSLKGTDDIDLDPNDNSGIPNVNYGDNEGMNELANTWLMRPKTLSSIYADGTGKVGSLPNGEYCYGKTYYKGFKSSIYLSKGAFKSNAFLFLVLQHEYAHVYMNQGGNAEYTNAQEVAAYSLSINQSSFWRMDSYTYFFSVQKSYYKNLNFNNTIPGFYPIEININPNYILHRLPK